MVNIGLKLIPSADGNALDGPDIIDPASEAVISSSVDIERGQINKGAARRVHKLVAQIIGKVGVHSATVCINQSRDNRVDASVCEA